eukprot:Nk52_evm12s62 gene=Nk52_evmTU12s62
MTALLVNGRTERSIAIIVLIVLIIQGVILIDVCMNSDCSSSIQKKIFSSADKESGEKTYADEHVGGAGITNRPDSVLESSVAGGAVSAKHIEEDVTNRNGMSSSTEASNVVISGRRKRSLAIAFYVTNNAYACYTLTHMHRVRGHFNVSPALVDIVVLVKKDAVKQEFLEEMKKVPGAHLHFVSHSATSRRIGAWADSNLKLQIFRLYEKGYEQVIYFDSDGLLVRNPLPLFELPSMPSIAWTKMSWGSSADFMTSIFMVFRPSADLWGRIEREIDRNFAGRGMGTDYDMDILNRVAGHEDRYSTNLPMTYGFLDRLLTYYDDEKKPEEARWPKGTIEQLQSDMVYVHFTHFKPFAKFGRGIVKTGYIDYMEQNSQTFSKDLFLPLYFEVHRNMSNGIVKYCPEF